MNEQIFPKAQEFIKRIEEIYRKASELELDIDEEQKNMTEDFLILMHPMSRLAEVLFAGNPLMAVELAKYIAIMNDDIYIDKDLYKVAKIAR